jgi:hypothetical protein
MLGLLSLAAPPASRTRPNRSPHQRKPQRNLVPRNPKLPRKTAMLVARKSPSQHPAERSAPQLRRKPSTRNPLSTARPPRHLRKRWVFRPHRWLQVNRTPRPNLILKLRRNLPLSQPPNHRPRLLRSLPPNQLLLKQKQNPPPKLLLQKLGASPPPRPPRSRRHAQGAASLCQRCVNVRKVLSLPL